MGKSARKKTGATAVAKGRQRPSTATAGMGYGTALWWGCLGCGAMVVLSPASAILLAALIVPVLLVTVLPDDGPGRRITSAALLFGLAGSVRPLHQLWDAGATVPAAMTILHRPIVLLTSWTAIMAGWFVGELAGIVLKAIADVKASVKRRGYQSELATLEEEWGSLASTASVIKT